MNFFNPIFLFWDTSKRFSYEIRTALVQMAICLLLMWCCWWLYERFNTIPVFKNEIELYEYKSKDINPKIWFNANINYGIYKYTTVPKKNGLMYFQDTIKGKIISPVFTDSLISEAKLRAQQYNKERIGEGIMSGKYLSLHDTLTKYVDTFNINNAIYIVDMKYKQTYPNGLAVNWVKKEDQIIDNQYKYTRFFDSMFGEDYDTGQKTIEGHIIKVESDQTSRSDNLYMFWNGLTYGNTLSNSFLSIFNLYDISQAYVIFKYTGNANLDHIRFNFGSAVMCTGINPDQAEIGMNYLIYKDSVFLNSSKILGNERKPINDFEMRFHVAPKDTQNLQTMRLFLLTTLFSLVLTFFISALLKVLNVKFFPYILLFHRFVPQKRDNGDNKIWSVYDNQFKEYSKFSCHKNYETKEVCEFYINECNNRYKKHFKASIYIKTRNKKANSNNNDGTVTETNNSNQRQRAD